MSKSESLRRATRTSPPSLVLSLCVALWGSARPALAEEPRGEKDVRSLRELRRENVVRQAWDLSCGAAALSTLLTFHVGDPVSEAEIIRSVLRVSDPVRIRARRGFSLLDLKRFAVSRGHQADGYGKLDLPHLVRMAPAIVPTRIGGYNHFVVFRGLDGDRVLLADPAFGNRTMTVERFVAMWPSRIAFVVTPAGGQPPPGESELLSGPRASFPPGAVVRDAIGVLR
jgi:predicted double-glycine peptidase